jgi:hypothetical protein
MKVTIFTDKNLRQILQKGWSEERLVNGQIATLTGRKFSVNIEPTQSIRELKHKIEDQEGIEVQNQEIRKGKTVLKDENTIEYYFITEKITLLLINSADIYEAMVNTIREEGDHLKQKEKPKPTETLVLTEDEAKKLNPDNKNWWERGNTLSGPRKAKTHNDDSEPVADQQQPNDNDTTGVNSNEINSPLRNFGGGTLGGGSQQNIITNFDENSPEHRRELMRRAMEARLNKR